MKLTYLPVVFLVLMCGISLFSCKKDTSQLPDIIVYPDVLNGTWTSTKFENVTGDTITFTISSSTLGSVVNKIVGFNNILKTGDTYIFGVSQLTDGNFFGLVRYLYTSGSSYGYYSRNCIISLQNNNTQMMVSLVDGGPGNAPVSYVYQKVK